MNMEFISTSNFQQITRCSGSRHNCTTTIKVHFVVRLTFSTTGSWPHRATAPWDFSQHVTLLRLHPSCYESGHVPVDANFSGLMT